MAQEGKPGWTAGSRRRPGSQDPTNHVLVDLDTEGQTYLFRDSWTSPGRIALLNLNDGIDQFSSWSFWTGLRPEVWREEEAILSFF
jgi:hypothetical protein